MSNSITKELKQKKIRKKNQIVPEQGTISIFFKWFVDEVSSLASQSH